MSNLAITIPSISHLGAAAADILNFAGNSRIFLFYGDMGAGKTTLIKALCSRLGATEAATSPTFSIVNEYRLPGGKIYHFDFYRLKNQSEALDLGYEEYFFSGDYCFVEWPEKIPDLFPDNYVKLTITVNADNSRNVLLGKI